MTTSPTNRRLRAAGLVLLALTGVARADTPPEPSTATAAPPTPSAPGTRAEAHAEFKRLLEAGEFAAAADQARKVVELTEGNGSGSPEELQVALMNLALAQHRAGDYVAAEASYLRVIELIEAAGRLTSPRLARAQAGLATTYYAARRYDLAAATFEQAIALNRRAEGLFNEGQLPLLEKQSDALAELGRYDEALLARRYALRVAGRKHGERSLPYARELESLGRWYTRVGAYEAGRAVFRQAIELVVSLSVADSLELIGPLTGTAENARRWLSDPSLHEPVVADPQRGSIFHDAAMPTPPGLSPSTIASEGQKALDKAAAIVGAHPDAPATVVAGVRVQVGDWYQARQQPERALPHYRQAWQTVGAAPDGTALRQSLFGAPVLLSYVAPENWNRHARRPPEEVELRHVEIVLTVTAQGGVRDPSAVADAGDQRFANQALRAVQTARYRPRLVDGEPTDTNGVRFVQPCYVLREDAPAEKPAAPAEPAAPTQGGG